MEPSIASNSLVHYKTLKLPNENLTIHSQDNTIKLLDCNRLTLQGINFDMPQNELIIEAEGDKCKK